MVEIIVILCACLLLLLPIKSAIWLKIRPIIALLSLSFLLLPLIFVSSDLVNVRVRATHASNSEAQGNEIHMESVSFDGVTQDLQSLFPGNSWNNIESRLAWRVYDEGCRDVIYDQWPLASEYSISFQKSRWRGIVEVQIGDDFYTVDCYAPVDYGETEVLAVAGPSGASRASKLIAYGATALALVLVCIFIPKALKFSKPAGRDPGMVYRENWSDTLRALSAFFIVIMGVSGGVFKEYGLNYPSGIAHMVLFVFSSFAIPVFFMLTGAFLLHRNETPLNTLKKRVPSVAVPLATLIAISFLTMEIWSEGSIGAQLSYVYNSLSDSFNTVPKFLFLLTALYIIAPVLRPVYISAEKSTIWYAVCAVCVLPGIVYTAFALLGINDAPLTIAALISNIGQFMLGALLVTYKEKLAGKWIKPALVAVLGLALSLVSRNIILLNGGFPEPTPFAAGIEATLLGGGMFALFLALSPVLDAKTSTRLSALIKQISSLVIGVLMSYTILYHRIPTLNLGNYVFEINSRAIERSIGIGLFYIIISLAISYIISCVPVLKRVIGLEWYTAGKRGEGKK